MAHRWKNNLTWDDVTPEAAFLNRRQIIAGMAAGGIAAGFGQSASAAEGLEPNTWEEITTYNNFYEFGTGKGDPAKYAGGLTTDPWSVEIDGLVDNPGSYAMSDIMSAMTTEERI
ncbi:MAG: mononuclear molybdenum enzyme YedY, partial [Pseudomonadota bacterium]|nr:mononuclear molybdenum enzyme YedY [Pseudomonadota bacterium]